MWPQLSQVFLAIFVVGMVFSATACSAGSNAPGDIVPMTPIKAQSAPKSEPTHQSQPMAPNLRIEMMEPASPISPTAPTIVPTPVPAVPPASQSAPPLPGSDQALAATVADLSKRTGLSADQITLVSMEVKEWSDTSLGCPQEGMMYAQVITPGYLIILQAQGQPYEYHTDQAGNSVELCQR